VQSRGAALPGCAHGVCVWWQPWRGGVSQVWPKRQDRRARRSDSHTATPPLSYHHHPAGAGETAYLEALMGCSDKSCPDPSRGHCVSIFLDKDRRHIGKSQSERPPTRTQRPPHRAAVPTSASAPVPRAPADPVTHRACTPRQPRERGGEQATISAPHNTPAVITRGAPAIVKLRGVPRCVCLVLCVSI
jgi:hypothetical protein